MKPNHGAQYEISIDGVPHTYRDRQDIAVQTARLLKARNPRSVVKMRGAGEETVVAFKSVVTDHRREPAMGHFLTRLGVYTASPLAFLVLIVYAALWYVFKPETFEWHAVATLATWGMTLVIQRAEHRDTQAIHAKLDEILHALGDARNEITRMDEKEPEEIERRREHMRKDD